MKCAHPINVPPRKLYIELRSRQRPQYIWFSEKWQYTYKATSHDLRKARVKKPLLVASRRRLPIHQFPNTHMIHQMPTSRKFRGARATLRHTARRARTLASACIEYYKNKIYCSLTLWSDSGLAIRTSARSSVRIYIVTHLTIETRLLLPPPSTIRVLASVRRASLWCSRF